MEDIQVNMNKQNTEVKSLNGLQKLFGVFISPTKVMESIEVKPGILLPLILMAVAPVLLIISRYSAYLESLRLALEEAFAKKNMQMTAEQLAVQLKMTGMISVVGTPIVIAAMWLIGTAILFGLVKIFKGQGNFKQYLSITAYSGVILILYYIVAGVVSAFTGMLDFKTPVTSVVSLLPQDFKETFLYGLLTPIDLFTIWQYALIAIGVIQVSKLEKNKVYGIIGIIYAAFMLYGGIGQAIAGMLSK